MAELLDDQEEKKLQIRLKSQRHIRAFLIVINMVLIAYLLFFIGDIVVDYVKAKDNDIVALCNLSRTKSKKKYEEILKGKEATSVADYVLYGTYFHISEEVYQPNTFTSVSEIRFHRVNQDGADSIRHFPIASKKLNKGVDLAELPEGDYLVQLGDAYIKIVLGNERWEETVYSLPDYKTQLRKKITIYAYPHNPAFVIKIRDEKRLPKDVYDLILQGPSSARMEVMKALEENEKYKQLKIKELNENTALSVSYPLHASYAIELKEDTNQHIDASSFLESSFESQLFSEEISLDKNDFIRELGGYALGSGSRNQNVPHSYDVLPYQGIHDAGKMAFTIYSSANHWMENVEKIFSFLTPESANE